VLLFFPVLLFSQVIESGNDISITEDSLGTQFDSEEKLEAGYFYLDNVFEIIPFRDTVLDDLFPYYDPLSGLEKDIVDKGYIGSAAMVLGEKDIMPGFDLGYHQYDLYEKNMDVLNGIRAMCLSPLYFFHRVLMSMNFGRRQNSQKNLKIFL